jgi:hypothetical protein
MNIFVLDLNPVRAASMLCDKHVPKMATESAQMLASALRANGASDMHMPLTQAGRPYRGGYHRHPCTVWAGVCIDNYEWLAWHGEAICQEYMERFGKQHACDIPIRQMADQWQMIRGQQNKTPFAQAMPDQFRDESPVVAYRNYYRAEKSRFASWDRCRHGVPDWWNTTPEQEVAYEPNRH